MSDFENPYQRPETQIVPENSHGTGLSLSEKMLRYLKEASPWLRFIGILGFIGCGMMVLGGIISVIVGAATGFSGELVGATVWLTVLIYLPIGLLFFFPSYFTYLFGAKIRKYLTSQSYEDLELAFKNNKSLWKFYGIMCIVYLALIPVLIVLMVAGVAATSGLFF